MPWSTCGGACAGHVPIADQAACQGACVAEGWSGLQDFHHKPPRWLARRQQRQRRLILSNRSEAAMTRHGGQRGLKSRGDVAGASSGFTGTWTEGLQLKAEYNSSLSLCADAAGVAKAASACSGAHYRLFHHIAGETPAWSSLLTTSRSSGASSSRAPAPRRCSSASMNTRSRRCPSRRGWPRSHAQQAHTSTDTPTHP